MTTTADSMAPEELNSRLAAGEDILLLDVRSAAEFESLHIRGSYNVPLPLLAEHTAEFAGRLGTTVVLVCRSGARATEARTRLAAAGFPDALVLTGGVQEFERAGGKIVTGAQRWSLERQVRMAAGSLVVAGLAGGKFLSPQIRTVAGVIGAGLTFSAATDTCAMGKALSLMPWNRGNQEPTRASVLAQLPGAEKTTRPVTGA